MTGARADLREAVARAIYESRNGPGCKPWARLPTAHKVPYLIDADAALAAVRRGDPRVHGGAGGER